MKNIWSLAVASTFMATVFGSCLFGCASDTVYVSGPVVTKTKAAEFKVGTATFDEVVASLGQPSFSAVRPNGEKVIGYMRSQFRAKPSASTSTSASSEPEMVDLEVTLFYFDNESKLLRVERE